jgi:alpha,alpha-trehalase
MKLLIQMQGELFEAVQLSRIFPDSKTFVDSTPKSDPEKILYDYNQVKDKAGFDLKTFVLEHFHLPKPAESQGDSPLDTSSLENYISSLWSRLKRTPQQAEVNSTLIPLTHDYIVPGGRFNEIYYWDSYFTMLGLVRAGKLELIESMVKNFIHLQESVGLIPNGNRYYYAKRSQPPVLYLMLELLWNENYQKQEDGLNHVMPYAEALEREHTFWMQGERTKTVKGYDLNHYWGGATWPRQESFYEDYTLAQSSKNPEALYRHLHAGAESGWDFSSRWFADPNDLATIQTTDILPVDLNALLFGLESTLAKFYELSGDTRKRKQFTAYTDTRREAIQKIFWNDEENFFFDYTYKEARQTAIVSAAGIVPLFVKAATAEQATKVEKGSFTKLLARGGVLSTTVQNQQQWDSPNGWAPLQWFAVQGFKNYDVSLHKVVQESWLTMIQQRFSEDKKLLEKYDVVSTDQRAGGGEYGVQEGFGWTNGVTLEFLKSAIS